MNFDLDERQREFQHAVAEYLQSQCPKSRALAAHDGGAGDDGIWRGLMELGIGGLMVAEAYGGLGLGLLDLAAVAEVVGRFAAPGPFVEHSLATLAIALAGSDAQKRRWLPALASGERRATIAIAEGKGDWTADAWSLDGTTMLSGGKRHVLHAEHADLIVVGLKGGRMGIVERGSNGLAITPTPSTDAGKKLARVDFVETPLERLREPAGAQVVDAGLVLLAADAFGGASRCVEMSVDYSRERRQFGRPIGAFQAVKHQLANMAVMVEPAIGLYWYAAHAFDAAMESTSEAAAIAKAYITEIYPSVTRQAIEAHGGIGYTWEFGLHVWLKRALFDQAYLGMPQAHRVRIAGFAGW